jgi:hypothetical protein
MPKLSATEIKQAPDHRSMGADTQEGTLRGSEVHWMILRGQTLHLYTEVRTARGPGDRKAVKRIDR